MEHIRTVSRVFATGPSAVLHVEARSGAVVVEAHDAPEVRVEAVVRIWSDLEVEADEAAVLVERGLEQNEHRVMIRAPSLPMSEGWTIWSGRRGSRVDYQLRVPTSTAVRVLSRSGLVRIVGTHGRVHVESGSGRCSVEDVTGNVAIIARSGSLAIARVHGELAAETRSGRIEVRDIDGPATVEARSGAADIRNVSGAVDVRAHTGSISVSDVAGGLKASAHTGAVRYRGKIEADFDIRARTGTIHLSVDPDRPFFIDAESQLGSVRSELPPRRGGAVPNGAGPKVRLRTHTGSIRLSRL